MTRDLVEFRVSTHKDSVKTFKSAGKFGASPEQRGGVQGDMERSGDARSKCGERICVLF